MPAFFITTAIDYTNGAPHLGHAYEKVLADVLARYHRLKGEEVFLLTGVDQHGQKVQQSAEKEGVAPQEFVDGVTAKFVALWEKLGVQYDGWAATTAPRHKDFVRAILQRLWDDRDPATGASRWLYRKSEGGWYSVRQEQFLTDKERGADGEFGAEWQSVEFREEENFYFRLLEHKQWLLAFIDERSAAGRPFVVPDFRVAELRNAVEKLEGDLCISRPAARLQWGIPFPESFGAGFVTYVWFDALVNYLSFAPGDSPSSSFSSSSSSSSPRAQGSEKDEDEEKDEDTFRHLWPPLHVIGKDILIPAHGVYWPIMLKALGFTAEQMPTLLVHGWWNISGAKMSKSLGNSIDPGVLAEKYGAEAVRYYLVSDIATGRDADFSEERLIQRYNTDLANSLGNLLNRTLSMAGKYLGAQLKASGEEPPESEQLDPFLSLDSNEMAKKLGESIGYLARWAVATRETYRLVLDGDPDTKIRGYAVNLALEIVIKLVSACNLAIEVAKPWTLAKDPAQIDQLNAVLYQIAESLRIIAILLSPVLPQAAHGIFDQLNWKMDLGGTRSCASPSDGNAGANPGEVGRAGARPSEERFRLADATWGGLPDGHQLGQPTPLFPRIETPAA